MNWLKTGLFVVKLAWKIYKAISGKKVSGSNKLAMNSVAAEVVSKNIIV